MVDREIFYMSLWGGTVPSSGNCNVILESLTFYFLGKIKPSLHDLDSRVTQGMSEVGFLPSCVSELDLGKKKKKKTRNTMNACTKQCLWDSKICCYYYLSKIAAELLETVLNLYCQENNSDFGKWGKRDKYCHMPSQF